MRIISVGVEFRGGIVIGIDVMHNGTVMQIVTGKVYR